MNDYPPTDFHEENPGDRGGKMRFLPPPHTPGNAKNAKNEKNELTHDGSVGETGGGGQPPRTPKETAPCGFYPRSSSAPGWRSPSRPVVTWPGYATAATAPRSGCAGWKAGSTPAPRTGGSTPSPS